MPTTTLSRTVWYDDNGERRVLTQDELFKRRESLVVLGEAGMGKTALMLSLGHHADHTYFTARKFKNAPVSLIASASKSGALVIDALDELSTRSDGDAVDVVLQKLGELRFPRFVMSCRAADWRTATAVSAIGDFYGEGNVLVVHLEPFNDGEALRLLADELGDAARATKVIEHFEKANLEGLLGNPQTLQLVAAVAASGALPDTKGALFEGAVEVLRREHRGDKVDVQPDKESALDAAGAAFAALILTGSDALLVGLANSEDGEAPIAEVHALPGANALVPVLGTRLFATAGSSGRFTYSHRRIGEFLGSRWLAKQADTAMKRKRVIALFRSHGLVPASLRGLHAWLAYHDPLLGIEVIAADPLGVIEYGDADSLSPFLANALLDALSGISERDLSIGGREHYQARSLATAALLERVRAVLNAVDIDFAQGLVVLDAVKGSQVASHLRDDFRRVLLKSSAAWPHRIRALKALLVLGGENWQDHVDVMLGCGESGWQIMQAIEEVGLHAFDDKFLVRCVVTHALSSKTSVSMLMRFEALVPDSRLEGVLDELVTQIEALAPEKTEASMTEVNALGFEIVSRVLERNLVDAARLWRWLKPLRSDSGYRRTGNDKVAAHLAVDATLRRAVQRLVLLGELGEKTVFQRTWRMTKRSRGLALTEEDVAHLLDSLDPVGLDENIWRDLLAAVAHSEIQGALARAAAKRLVADRPDMQAWIDKLVTPAKPEWQERSERKQRVRAAQQAVIWQEHREQFTLKIDEMRRGEFAAIVNPAYAYLGLFSDLPHAQSPLDRLKQWLGTDLTDAALQGFEAYLKSSEPPSAQEVAEANAEQSRLKGALIVVAALAERVRSGKSLGDVNDDRLTVGFFEARHGALEEQAKIQDFGSAIEAEIRRRDLYERVLRVWIEPQLERRLQHADQIHGLLWGDEGADSATATAEEWLARFPDMAERPEFEIIHRLIESQRYELLAATAAARLQAGVCDARRRNWKAVAFLTNSKANRAQMEADAAQDPELIFALRDVVRRRRGEALSRRLTVDQLGLAIAVFRRSCPWFDQPEGASSGETNAWDATEFIVSLMRQLADMTSAEALSAVDQLIAEEDDRYSRYLQRLSAEQLRKLAEERYLPPLLFQIRAVVEARAPQSVSDLRATLLVLLEQVQKRILSDPVDSWRGFFKDDGEPHDEERCRDHLLILLGIRPEGIDLHPEGHLAADKRADIIGSLAGMRLPIEVKGQWHKDLWHAADSQLDRLYATDYAAERQGIYLVFWFGASVSRKFRLPGNKRSLPSSPEELRIGLMEGSSAAKSDRIAFVVLDIERPSKASVES